MEKEVWYCITSDNTTIRIHTRHPLPYHPYNSNLPPLHHPLHLYPAQLRHSAPLHIRPIKPATRLELTRIKQLLQPILVQRPLCLQSRPQSAVAQRVVGAQAARVAEAVPGAAACAAAVWASGVEVGVGGFRVEEFVGGGARGAEGAGGRGGCLG